MRAGDARLSGEVDDPVRSGGGDRLRERALGEKIDREPIDVALGGQLLTRQMGAKEDVTTAAALREEVAPHEAGGSDDQEAHA